MPSSTSQRTSPHRIDRRIARTRSALRAAMLSLIEEKGYDAVTVEEIAQRANVGRATFYLHYRDKEEILLEQLSELARDRVRLLAEIPLTGWDMERNPAYEPLLLVFQHAAENADMYRVLLQGEGAARITERMRNIIVAALQLLIQNQDYSEALSLRDQTMPIDFLATYMAGSLIGSIAWWLQQASPPSPEEMTRMFQRMFFPGIAQILGLVQGNETSQ